MIGSSLLGGNSLFELQQTETNYWEPEKNTLQYVKHEVQTSLVEETDLKTKTMRMWCSGEVCLSGNGEERRSGEAAGTSGNTRVLRNHGLRCAMASVLGHVPTEVRTAQSDSLSLSLSLSLSFL